MSKRELLKIPVDELEEKKRQEEHTVANQNSNSSTAIIDNNSNSSRTTTSNDSLKTKLKALYKAQDTLPKLIDDERLQEQSLTKYYIKLQVLLKESEAVAREAAAHDKVMGEKAAIEIENIFSQVDEAHPEAGKVLLLGGAGVGKTTLLHYMSYRWGVGATLEAGKAAEGLWNDKFDYVFRVRLKELLDDGWKGDYDVTTELRKDKLGCFIHHCLKSQEGALGKKAILPSIEPQEVLSIENKDKVLLLLDGYDEIAHLAKSNSDYHEIMGQVFQYKHVVMSSRPNALGGDIKGKFERTIESKGLDFEGIIKYIDLSFKDKGDHDSIKLGEELKLFLTTTPQVRGMCEIPINTALMCLIWEDEEIREKFAGSTELNIGQLYHEVIVWLGKRYLEKFENRDLENITEENVFLSDEVQFLRNVAHQAFIETGKLVTSKVIKENLGKLDIRKVNKYGLLKPEGDGKDIIKLNHQFVHLTFQEYLTAYYLKDQLIGNKPTEIEKAKKAAYFIGTHRNEPKYLMTLKFLAGIISSQEYDNENSNNQQATEAKQLVTRFWEAVTCNVDGVLELGIETKVTLLMHLLAQGKTHGKTDQRIPNLKTIEQLIDEVVLQDITKWGQQIIESGYVSKAIAKTLISIMGQKEEVIPKQELSSSSQAQEQAKGQDDEEEKEYEDKQDKKKTEASKVTKHNLELKVAAEIVTSLRNKSELGGREVIFKFLISLVDSKDWQVQKIGLDKLKQITDKTIEQGLLKICAQNIIPLLDNTNLNNSATNLLIEIIKHIPTLEGNIIADKAFATGKSLKEVAIIIPSDHALKALRELLSDPKSNDWLKSTAAGALKEVIKIMPAAQAIEKLKEVLVDPRFGTWGRSTAAESLYETIKTMPEKQGFIVLEALLLDSKVDQNVKKAITWNITKFVKAMQTQANEFFKVFSWLLLDPNTNFAIKSQISEGLQEVVKIMPGEDAIKALKMLMTICRADWMVKSAIEKSLPEAIKTMPSKKAYEALIEFKKDSECDNYIKRGIAGSLKELLKVTPDLAPQAFVVLQDILKDSKTDESATSEAIECIKGIVSAKSSLANEAFELLMALSMAPMCAPSVKGTISRSLPWLIKAMNESQSFEILIKILEDPKSDWSLKREAAETIPVIVKTEGSLATKAFETFKKLLLASETSLNVTNASIWNLPELVKAAPNLASQVFDLLSDLLSDLRCDSSVRAVASDRLSEVVKIAPDLASKALEVIKRLLDDQESKNNVKAISHSLLTIAQVMPSLADESFGILLKLITSIMCVNDVEIKLTVIDIIFHLKKVVEAEPNLASKALEVIKMILADQKTDQNTMEALADSLGTVVKARSNLAEEVLNTVQKILIDHERDNSTKGGLLISLPIVAKSAPILASEVVQTLKRILITQENDNGTKRTAVAVLPKIVEVEPSLTNEVLEVLKEILRDQKTELWVNYQAANSTLEITKTMPLNKSADLLNNSVLEVRKIAQKTILARLKNKVEVTKIDYTQMITLLEIIDITKRTEQGLEKELYLVANIVLKTVTTTIDETGIKWFNDHFNDLPNSSEAKSFLKDLYHKVLSHAEVSGKLSDTEVEFIIKCIVGRSLTSIIIPREGKIIFEDTTYKLLESTEKLTEIVEAVLKQSEDSLAIQYRDHEPLFVNTGSALPVAAADIKDGSLVDGQELQSNSWKLSLMHLSNHKQEAPSKVFILLERRGDTGEHLLYKLSISEGKLHSQYYPLDPRLITTDFRKGIFGEMEYTHTKPKYYGSTSEITKIAGEALINQVKQAVSIVGSTHSENFTGREYEVLHRLLTNSSTLVLDSANSSFDASWDEYAKQKGTITFEKAALLKVDSGDVRRESKAIDLQDQQHIQAEQINDHTERLTKVEKKIQIHTKALANIQGTLNILEYVTQEIHKEVEENKELSAQEKAKRHEEIKSLDQSVKGIVMKVDAQEPIIQEITSEMKDLLIRKGTDTKTFITLYKKVKGIEEQLTNPTMPKVSMLHQADDQEESDVIELQAKVITTPVPTSSSGQQDATRVTVLQNKNPITIKIQPKHSTEAVPDTTHNIITSSNSLPKAAKAQDSQGSIPVKPQPDHEHNNNQSSCCSVMMVYNIKYNNPVLNHPELLRQFNNLYGKQNLSKLIDFGRQFTSTEDRTTLEEICNSQDAFNNIVIMMGLNSLPVEF